MPPIKPEDLPGEIQAILDTPAEEGACLNDQPVCTPDPRVTAQLTDEPRVNVVQPWRIANAYKGNLILIPGGPAGMIGGLLSQIDPPQYFSHMGIMTQDFVELRHATVSEKRLRKFPHYANSEGDPGVSLPFIPGIGEAPTDGFQQFALQYLWPGTLTQSVEKAYLTWQDHPTVKNADGDDVPDPKFSELDTKSGERFHIDAMTFGPVKMTVRGREMVVPPLVVQPCPLLETDAVRGALDRIAEEAKTMPGHYRFYSYTKAEIGLDPNQAGLQTLETQLPDAGSPCTGQKRGLTEVLSTIPMVCSTFIWLAVQRINGRGARPRIILDGRPQRQHRQQPQGCEPFFAREPNVDKIDAQTKDGLYLYGKGERQAAGKWLHKYLHDTVTEEIASSTDFQGKLDTMLAPSGKKWNAWDVLKLLASFSLTVVSLILGISGAALGWLVKVLTDMPDDVASQVTNCFANDHCDYTAKDSDAWDTDPGEGRTVSPDNILNSWAPPTSEDREFIHGLYGYNWEAIVRPPEVMLNPPPPSSWQISQGFGAMEGVVRFQGVGVGGAEVRVGCTRWRTNAGGGYMRQNLPSGRYWATARWVHPTTGLLLEAKGRPVEIPAGGGIGQMFDLEEPPDTRRKVWVEGHMDLVNRYAVGKDWWDHPGVNMAPAYLGLDYFPDQPEFAAERAASLKQTRGDSHQVDDWGQAVVQCDMEIQNDKSIKMTCRGRLQEKDDEPWQEEHEFTVPPKANNSDPGVTHVIDLVRSEMAWPVRAHIELVVHNNRAA